MCEVWPYLDNAGREREVEHSSNRDITGQGDKRGVQEKSVVECERKKIGKGE